MGRERLVVLGRDDLDRLGGKRKTREEGARNWQNFIKETATMFSGARISILSKLDTVVRYIIGGATAFED